MHPSSQHDALARAILRVLDAPRRKSDMPIKPMLVEFIGTPKSGKDGQLVNQERRFKRYRFNVLVHQEGAESEDIRRVPRDFSYAMQLTYLTQAFDRMLHAAVSRDFHMIFFNRGVLDILYWLEFQVRTDKITERQRDVARAFIMEGPWIDALDAVICLTTDVETALVREYGHDYRSRDIKFGFMMSPQGLTLMKECVDKVLENLRMEAPDLPLFVIDTSTQTKEDTDAEIASVLFSQFEKRLRIGEDQVLPWNLDLMKERAWVAGPELKFLGPVSHERLRRAGWVLDGTTEEVDEYISPKGQNLLGQDECFHIRTSGGRSYFIFKRNAPLAIHRPRILVPIKSDDAKDLRAGFDPVTTVKKQREIFTRSGFLLHRDKVEGLGKFIEIKGVQNTTHEELLQAARELGLTEDKLVPMTYLRLKLEQKN